jgi:hypothetical protein
MAQEDFQFFSDSSSHRGHTYMVVGGIVLPPHRTKELTAKMKELKELSRMGPNTEFKWSGYKNGEKKRAYFGLVDHFYKMIDDGHMHFHALICNFNEFDHKRDNPSGPKNMFKSVNKLYYQLLVNQICRRYGQKHKVAMYPDHGNDSAEIISFRESVCKAAYFRHQACFGSLIRIQPYPSKTLLPLQLPDVILGGIAALRENRTLSAHKQELGEYILEKSPVSSWDECTNKDSNFTLWHWKS